MRSSLAERVIERMGAELRLDEEETARRRRVRRNAIILGLVAVAFYVGFIVLTVIRDS